MRVDAFLAYSPWVSPREQIALAVHADAIGIDGVWVSESYGYDVVSILGAIAVSTDRVSIGSGLMQIPARTSSAAAMAAAGLDALSAGRMRLGLGVSGPQVSEEWYGVPYVNGIARTRQYVEVVRAALAGERVNLSPGSLETRAPTIRLLAPPVQETVPIYLGSMAPGAIDLCFEIADGWLPFVIGTEMLSERPLPDRPFDIAATLPVAVADTVEEARDAVRPWLAFYFGAMGSRKKHFFVELAERYGYGPAARRVQEHYLAGDRDRAAAALTDDLIDAAALASTDGDLARRLSEYAAAGATTFVGILCGDRMRTLTALAKGARSTD
ncbi:LLM class flavin-dependent oxidoreductase [Rhodococcus opacus]|uniref:LLM class flavin-dependent oxidoreductase n=1 Tax=Rhodococcus opacus TaxID=37919 RepID=UPI0024745383|nr:LLM class flavin-dependent oxidoreductase [Rhodococcus opacus]MDH6293410.1 F420-dependent oxidoreductase-like protein [Rhodococcus opacus]